MHREGREGEGDERYLSKMMRAGGEEAEQEQ